MICFGRTDCCLARRRISATCPAAMKDFLDRTFYPVEGKILSLPYAIFISAGNDGSGALRAIRRIANGYPFREVQEPLIAQGEVTDHDLNRAEELGMTLAAGIEAGIY